MYQPQQIVKINQDGHMKFFDSLWDIEVFAVTNIIFFLNFLIFFKVSF